METSPCNKSAYGDDYIRFTVAGAFMVDNGVSLDKMFIFQVKCVAFFFLYIYRLVEDGHFCRVSEEKEKK